MSTISLILSENKSDFSNVLSPGIRLEKNKNYEAALVTMDMYYSIPNITNVNNNFTYSTDNGNTWKTILLDIGSYELISINDEIQKQMIANADYDKDKDFYINITANISKLKSVIDITHPSYQIDFRVENSIGPTLGFSPSIISYSCNESTQIVNIMKINTILVNIDIISGSIVKGIQYPVIYSFFPKVAPGRKIIESPNHSLSYFPVNKGDAIDRVRVWLTDQDNKPIDIRGETLTIKIEIREVEDLKQKIKKAIIELKNENVL